VVCGNLWVESQPVGSDHIAEYHSVYLSCYLVQNMNRNYSCMSAFFVQETIGNSVQCISDVCFLTSFV